MPGRTRSLACEIKKHTSIVTTGSAGAIRRFLRNGFNGLLRALPGEPGFLATIISAMRKSIVANLTPASGRQDHTASPSAPVSTKAKPAALVPVPPKP